MSEREIERLRRELEEAKAREEEAKAREEEAKAEKEQLERKNRKTKLGEYLYNCHFHLYMQFQLADPSKSSTGHATRVNGKYYPQWLRPWTSFPNAQRQHLEVIRRVCGDRQLFDQESTTRDLGAKISRKRAGYENTIVSFEELAVEDPSWEILNHIWGDPRLRQEYRFAGLRFSHNSGDLEQPSDASRAGEECLVEEMQDYRRDSGSSKRRRVKPPPQKPDGWGIRTLPAPDAGESRVFVYDCKAAHKVAVEDVKSAVAKEKLFMEVIDRANSDKFSNDAGLRNRHKAEERIAKALTQVFDYMIAFGVAYGYIAAGQSLVFLYIERDDMQTLYYHHCVPGEHVGEPSAQDWPHKMSHTAVAQLASFCLLSLRSEALEGAALEAVAEEAEEVLRKWMDPYEDAAHLLEVEDWDSRSSPSAPSSQTTDGSEFRSDARPAPREVSLRSRSSCRIATIVRREDRGGDEEEDRQGDHPSRALTRAGANKREERSSSGGSDDRDVEMPDAAPNRQYCTQACLLGLKRGWDLDDNCPNVLSHRTTEGGTRHPIDASEFARLVGERLCQDPYRDCKALDGRGKVGAIGVLFKLELAPYGYTFVGKGTLSGHLRRLEHESRVYARLDSLQGEVVPVHLGLARLDRGYILPGGTRVVHMMLMSWAGETAVVAAAADVAAEISRSLQAVWAEGVDHGDERDANLLWNGERCRIMLVDFDRAILRPSLKHEQLFKVSGKKKQQGDDSENYTWKRGGLQGRLQPL